MHTNVKKNLFSLRLAQQLIRLSSLITDERNGYNKGSTLVEIASLAMQIVANEDDNREIAKVAKEIRRQKEVD